MAIHAFTGSALTNALPLVHSFPTNCQESRRCNLNGRDGSSFAAALPP